MNYYPSGLRAWPDPDTEWPTEEHDAVGELGVCQGCSALIVDYEVHQRWHQTLHSVAAMASSADLMTRPIGGTQ